MMHGSFYGWYMKCQSDTQTLAVIPALHQNGNKKACSIQFISDKNVWTVVFPGELFHHTGKHISIGENHFGENGIRLSVHTPELTVRGRLSFGPLFPLNYDIMGPFAFVPFLECRHSVWSMKHTVRGMVNINGEEFVFQKGLGYWEGDRGRSFPKEYLWTQCCFPGGSLMLSAADIPMAGIHFTGIIGVVVWKGKEYRLATYLGARMIRFQNRRVRVIQGNLELEVCLMESGGRSLFAPEKGNMIRTIHENVACRVFYRFRKNASTIFAFETEKASFEYEYPCGKSDAS